MSILFKWINHFSPQYLLFYLLNTYLVPSISVFSYFYSILLYFRREISLYSTTISLAGNTLNIKYLCFNNLNKIHSHWPDFYYLQSWCRTLIILYINMLPRKKIILDISYFCNKKRLQSPSNKVIGEKWLILHKPGSLYHEYYYYIIVTYFIMCLTATETPISGQK